MKPEAHIQNTQKIFEDALKQFSTFNTNLLQSLQVNSTPSTAVPNAKQIADSVLALTKAAKLAQETHLSHFKSLADAQFKASETVLNELSENGQVAPATLSKLATDFQQHFVSYGAAVAGLANEATRKTSDGKTARA